MHKTVKTNSTQGKNVVDNEFRVETSLPPYVKGQLRCFLAVQVDCLVWKVKTHPKDVQVCLQWWGDMGADGTMFLPVSGRLAANKSFYSKANVSALFPVCSGPKQFAAYLKDMGVLVLDILHPKTSKPYGKVEVHEITKLDGSNPIDRWYPVTSLSAQPVKFADLHVVLKFVPVDVVGHDLTSFVPVIDQNFEHSHVEPVDDGNKRNHSLDNLEMSKTSKDKILEMKPDDVGPEVIADHQDVNEDDLISSLIKRGQCLRDSIVESTASIDLEPMDLHVRHDLPTDREEKHKRNVPGSLLKEILRMNEADDIELTSKATSLPIDLILQDDNDDETLIYDYNSSSSIASYSDDPAYDDTLLQDLFYTNKDQSIIPMLDEPSNSNEVVEDDDEKRKLQSKVTHDAKETEMNNRRQRQDSGSAKDSDVKITKQVEVVDSNHTYNDTSTTFRDRNNITQRGSLQNEEFLSRLGIDKLTALGRVTAARVTINKLNLMEQLEKERNSRTYFIEYEFPVAASLGRDQKDHSSKDLGLEITRIATKKTTLQSVVFNHHSVFPAFFDSIVTSFWWNFQLKMKIFEREAAQKSPMLVGVGNMNLKTVLTSRKLQYDGFVDIRAQKYQEKTGQFVPSNLSTSSTDIPLLGKLEVRIDLMSNGKDLEFQASDYEQVQHLENAEPNRDVGNLKKCFIPKNNETKRVEQHQPPQIPISKTQATISNNRRAAVTLMTLIWISEGRNIVENGHGIRISIPGSTTRTNYYLISRMFWTNDTSRSAICWGQNDAHFNFRQVSPVLLTSALLNRMHNNFITVEVWNKTGGMQDDQLVGIAKLPLQQLYLSYKDEQITKALLKSKFPVVAVDGWINIKNPFKDSSQGDLRVLLALGSENQITRLQEIKQCFGEEDHQKLSTDFGKHRSQLDASFSHRNIHEKQVEHCFEITVQNVRKLFAFEKTLWGETDCFVQYSFPYQRPDIEPHTNDFSQDVPGLQNHRTPTTLCIPDTSFNDVARYRLVLPHTLPLPRFLLAAFHGSWTRTAKSAGVTFELWKRHYYPNIRDQLVAKGTLPLAKLCGMVTMQKPGETSIQSFSLPLTILPSTEDKKCEHGGILDVAIKYHQSKITATNTQLQAKGKSVEENTQVCLSIEIVRACGLKCALSKLAEKDSSLTYASEVGGNHFVKIKLPFNVKIDQRTTRTIARTFTPEFGYRMEFVLPLYFKDPIIGDNQESSGTLAECLEFGEVLCEVWHQRPRDTYEDLDEDVSETRGFLQRHFTPASDVLLGVVKIPLQQLLFSHTGIKGWFPVTAHTLGWSNEDQSRHVLDCTVGGLEVRMNFTEAKEREKIIEGGRAIGWSPPLWYEMEDGQWLNETVENGIIGLGQGLSFGVTVKKVWIPKVVIRGIQLQQDLKDSKQIGCYIRYKFYDAKAVFSAIHGLRKIKESDVVLCDLKHCHSYLVKTTSPFIWYIREEKLEIQVWLTCRSREVKGTLSYKRDKLVGSAFINLFPLLDGSKNRAEVSGLQPLFRSSAVHLGGAGLHVQVVLQKPSNSNQKFCLDVDEDIVSTEQSSSGICEKKSIAIESSDEENIEKRAEKREEKQEERSSSFEDDNDIITAHVIVEQALHLPLMKTVEDNSVQPNVYVTYQAKSNARPVQTKIVLSSTSPHWEHEKLIKFRHAEITKQILIFKVWHSQNSPETVVQSKADESAESVLVGLASVDLSPLASGLRQVMGWYNIVDFSGQCKGQIKKMIQASMTTLVHPEPNTQPQEEPPSVCLPYIGPAYHKIERILNRAGMKVGVIPLSPVSPQKLTLQDSKKNAKKFSDESRREKLSEKLTCFPKTANEVSLQTGDPAVNLSPYVGAPDSSKSFLLRQLRQNMSELELMKKKLQQRLMSSNEIFPTNPSVSKSLEQEVHKVHLHETKTNEVMEDDLMKVVELNCPDDDQPSPSVHDAPLNTSKSSDKSLSGEKKLKWHCLVENDVTNDHMDDGYVCDGNYFKHGDDDTNQIHKNHCIDEESNDEDRSSVNISSCNNEHPSYVNDIPNHNSASYYQNYDDMAFDGNRERHAKLSDYNQAVHNNEVSVDLTEVSGEGSLDSFFDCGVPKRNADEHNIKEQLNSSSNMADVQSVTTRENLLELKNIFNEETNSSDGEITTDRTVHDGFTDKGILSSTSVTEVGKSAAIVPGEETEVPLNRPISKQHHFMMPSQNLQSIPNFFMPPNDLEQSMRSLRLAATFRKEPRQDISQAREGSLQGVGGKQTLLSNERDIAKSFANWKHVEEIRTTGKVPLSSEETARLSKIFSFNYSTAKKR